SMVENRDKVSGSSKSTLKKAVILLLSLTAITVSTWFMITHVLINRETLSENVTVALSQATGRKAVMDPASAQVELLPTPRVVFSDLKLPNTEGASRAHFLEAKQVVLELDVIQLLQAKMQVSSLTLVEPVFAFEVEPSGKRNWQFNDKGQQARAFREYFLTLPVQVEHGLVHYANAATGASAELQKLNGQFRYEDGGELLVFEGNTGRFDKTIDVLLRMRSVDLTRPGNLPDVPFQLQLALENTTLSAQGMVSGMDQSPRFVGDVELRSPSIWAALSLFDGGSAQGLDGDEPEVLLKGKMTLDTQMVQLEKASIEVQNPNAVPAIKGKANIRYTFGKASDLKFIPHLEIVDLDYFVRMIKNNVTTVSGAATEEAKANAAAAARMPWWQFMKGVSGEVSAKIDSAFYRGRSINELA
ncbi:MAG: AsmA family protein, partial [Rickettsiales bacterium]